MLIAAKNMHDVLALKALLSQEFDMKGLGATTKIFGMEIHRNRGSRKLWLSQRGYIEKVLDRWRTYLLKITVQSIVALSTTEAEYMAVAEFAKEVLWLSGLSKELGVEQCGVQLHCDSQSAIYLANNQVYHVRTKYMM
ncbi:UNVERIFIED_CONTAM: Retrovirus-related Pol polyprotein from transposon TNT 1-94 [Sesamum calycinum]|uniref:Retrovirus-related Pol polyprotein from transposon TNT 1-94 n=1 Tax=Sesamum calycinum TaxID=2727403 RepID=A0AAW2QJZ9_9LAMI